MFEVKATLYLAFICGLVSMVTCTPQSDPEWDPEPNPGWEPEPWWNPNPSPGWNPEPSPGWDPEPDPEWDPEPSPEGVLGSCGDPGQVINAQRDIRSGPFSFGSVVTYTCNPGYQGWGSIVCQFNGIWSRPRPTCTAALCQDPGQIINAVRHGTFPPYRIGFVVTYTCNAGYTGGGTVTCQQNTRWTPLPICHNNSSTGGSPYQCPDPGYVLNADRSPITSQSTGTRVTYTCNPGYRGGGSIRCLNNGQWTPRPICDVIRCQSPRSVLNGVQHPAFGPFNSGSTVTYTCNFGYALAGLQSITCQANGQWSGPAPSCRSTGSSVGCGDPGQILNAVRNGNSFMFGDVVTYTCNVGYTMAGSGTITCHHHGVWSSRPRCVSTGGRGGCGDPGHVPNAIRTGSSFMYGDAVTYTCNPGYTMVGGGYVTCQANRQWTLRPTCVFHGVITGLCGDPGQVLHAERFVHRAAHHDDTYKYMEGKYPPATTVTYTCGNGYTGGGTITCQTDTSWTSKPICISPADSGDETTVLPPGELAAVRADDGDDDTTNILLIVFGTLILLVLIAILVLFLLRRRGIHPIQTVTAWWKKKRTGGNNNPPDQQRVESGYQGNPMPITTVAGSDGIGAVSNNVYMKANQGFINKPSVDAAEVKLSYEALKKKEAQLNEEPLHYENDVSFAALKQKEAQLNDEPSARDSHYEQVQDQKN